MSNPNTGRIAKNTALLYFRMMITMGINLYASRVILNALGIQDFGIYNVVGGVVAMFGFLNSSMTSSTQRFLTIELANNTGKLKSVFNNSMIIHLSIALVIVLLSATIGLWFFLEKMTIPPNRLEAATWTYIFSVLSAVIIIIRVPYNATIIAHEKMSAFAYISIFEAFFKLLTVYMLIFINSDRLTAYAVLSFICQLLISTVYVVYCKKTFIEASFQLVKDKSTFKEMLTFAKWSIFGNLSGIAFTQGLNLLLNVFFSPSINAARGIAVQVQQAVSTFTFNFQTAINPQLMKSYAQNDLPYMHRLIYSSSKFSYLLLFMISLPLLIETEMILSLWLKVVPGYTAIFTRIILCSAIIDATANSLMRAVDATGKIKRYQTIIGSVLLSILPISYVVLKLGGNPPSVFIVHLVICILAFIIRLFIIRPLIKLSITIYLKEVIYPILLVTLFSIPMPLAAYHYLNKDFSSMVIVSLLCALSVAIFSLCFGFKAQERNFLRKKIISSLKRFDR